MSTAETHGDPDDPSFHTADRPDHPKQNCANCGHDSDCATHNEPALPAGPCDCRRRWAKGGLIPGPARRLIGDGGSPDYVVPLRAWDHAHEKVTLFDGKAMITPEPTIDLAREFVDSLLQRMIKSQVEQFALLPDAPVGYRWEVVTEYPQHIVEHTREYRVTWRWVLRAIDGSDQ